MKYIVIFLFLLINIQIQAQGLYLSPDAKLYIKGASLVDGKPSAIPSLSLSGDMLNTGSIINAGEMQLKGNFVNIGTYSSEGDEVFMGSNVQNISGDFTGAQKFTHLIVNKSQNNLTLNGDIEVGASLELVNGSVELMDNNLSMTSGATIGETNERKYIITNGVGELKQTVKARNVVFPIGNSTFNPVIIKNIGVLDVFSARVGDVLTKDGKNTLETGLKVGRIWYLSEEIEGGSNASITTQWSANEEKNGFERTNSAVSFLNEENENLIKKGIATSMGANTWSQTQSEQTIISPRLVISAGVNTNGEPEIVSSEEMNVLVYPNPAQEEVYVSGNFPLNAYIKLTDMLGKEVLRKEIDGNTLLLIPLDVVSEGIYLLKVMTEKGALLHSSKLIKQ